MNAGILLPRSKAHPAIGSGFLEGIKASLQSGGVQSSVTLMTDTLGFGGAEKEVYASTEKMLLMEDADILVAFMDEKILELVNPLLQASGKLILVVNSGANYPLNWIPQPNIIRLGLQHSFLCALAGMDAAAAEPGARGAMVSSFYDCGYLHFPAMVKEFNAGNGVITHNYINNQLYDESFSITPLTDFLTNNPATRNLLCILDELPASLFYSLLSRYEKADSLRLFVSPMMLEQKALEKQGGGFPFPVTGYLPWHPGIANPENEKFKDYYQDTNKKTPGIFSLLGWEAGMILGQVLNTCSDFRNGESVVQALLASPMDTPRGSLLLDPGTQFYLAPYIKCSLPAHSAEKELEFDVKPGNQWADFSSESVTGSISGWTNTYPCY